MDSLKSIERSAALVGSGLIALASVCAGQSTSRASVATGGAQGNDGSGLSAVSADGSVIAFQSDADNLVPGDTNVMSDVFVHERATGQTTRVSIASDGSEAVWTCATPSLSADGRYVAFWSWAWNLVPPDTNAQGDCFVHDRLLGVTTCVSLVDGGGQGVGDTGGPAISGDGRWVAFHGLGPFVAFDINLANDVFVRDRETNRTYRASESTSGNQGNGSSYLAALSYDGRFVAFSSSATNLVLPDWNRTDDIFVRDMLLLQTTRVSVDSAGGEGNGSSSGAAISGDGRFVAFSSAASNLVPGDANGVPDVFVHDRATGITTRASVTSSGVEANAASASRPSISGDGRIVVFTSSATNLVPGVTVASQVYAHDRSTGETSIVSIGRTGVAGNQPAASPCVSGEGRIVAYESRASNLVAGDTNNDVDVFYRDRGGPGPVASCFGDGTGAACPCGNQGSTGRGCDNSFATGGARLAAAGFASVTFDAFLLSGDGMPTSASALYFQGTALLGGGSGVAFGDGLRCAGGQVIRLGTESNAAGASSHGAPAGDTPISVRGGAAAGDTFHFQVWYRNSATFCTTDTFNLTNAVTATWGP